MSRNEEYQETLDEYTAQVMQSFVEDLHLELDDIHNRLKHDEYSTLLISWVRQSLDKLAENYKR